MASHLSADVLDTAPCGFLIFDDAGRIRVVNATLAERLGYERQALIGESIESILTRPAQLFYQTHFFPLVKMHGRAQEIFLVLRARSGDTFGVLCNAMRRTRDTEALTECVLIEVHERRKYEEALLEAKRAADVANHAKSDFLATMSHELRTPLNAIGGYSHLLKDGIYGPMSAEQTSAVDRIMRSQQHLLGLVNDVLNLARIESGRVEYRIANVELEAVAAELAPMIEPQIAAKQLRYRVDLPTEPMHVRADREKLVQILLNLLSNAVKFTDVNGTIAMRVASSASDPMARIEVIDTGRGIPPDKVESVFEPFVQVPSVSAKPSEGTGLGLAISRNLARGMGGDLSATSEVGRGSCFTLKLARATAA